MLFRRIIVVNLVFLSFMLVGCDKDINTANISTISSTKEESKEEINTDEDLTVTEDLTNKNNQEISKNNNENMQKEKAKIKEKVEVKMNTEGIIYGIKEESSEFEDEYYENIVKEHEEYEGEDVFTGDEEPVEIIELKQDIDFDYPSIDELPSDVKEWALENIEKYDKISIYSNTTSTSTYVLASVKNDTGDKRAVIYSPYFYSNNPNTWVFPYSYYHTQKLLDSLEKHDYVIMKTNKPVNVEFYHATIYESENPPVN